MIPGRRTDCRFVANVRSTIFLPTLLLWWVVLVLVSRLPRSTTSFAPSTRFRRHYRLDPYSPSPSLICVPFTESVVPTTTAIMGIKGFRSWFESQFPRAITGMSKDGSLAHEEFDHVLIDMNQILHQVLRKSRSDGHCFTLLMKELDACVALATPTQSLVLAMDGSPGAAKLATQRWRRYQTVRKATANVAQLEKLIHATKLNSSKRAKKNIKQWTRKKHKALAELRTLCITPGTEFMAQAEQTLLYWAWQRLSARQTAISLHNVKIFISSSTVPGEGEVKLLEWMYTKPRRRGESVAILGGDSDLVLEALVIPVASTHNVVVVLPDGSQRCLSVSLWETTRALVRYLPTVITTPRAMICVRTDLVVLLILNGNDYLPKLRGSSGFNKLFHTYLRLQREWHAERPTTGGETDAFLVNPDTLHFNLAFAQAFFQRLARLAPANLWRGGRSSSETASGSSPNVKNDPPLQELNRLVEGGFLPKPIQFTVIDNNDEDGDRRAVEATVKDDENDNEENDDDSSEDENDITDVDEEFEGDEVEESDEDQILFRLQLGQAGSEDFFTYEIRLARHTSLKKARHELAAMALSDFLDEESEEEEADKTDDADVGGMAKGYSWEIHHNVEGNVETYLYGLLWNLQTYQDGVCSNYSFNYGKRMSPLAKEIAAFFATALAENRSVGQTELYPMESTQCSRPISAGLSCLAALPSHVKHLVPEPYRWLADETVEGFYASCMDPKDNVFDIKKFERLCDDALASLNVASETFMPNNQRDAAESEHYWTVVSKVPKPLTTPFDPPKPFSDRHAELKSNNKIRISRYAATSAPRPRDFLNGTTAGGDLHAQQARYSDPGIFFERLVDIEMVGYRVAYQKSKKQERRGLRKANITVMPQSPIAIPISIADSNGKHAAIAFDNDKSMSGASNPVHGASDDKKESREQHELKYNNLGAPPATPVENLDGETAIAVLKQLSDLELIGPIQVRETVY
jgi:XRN 5'-3' exonuclease N-terminus